VGDAEVAHSAPIAMNTSAQSMRKLTRREVRENSNIGSDGMTAIDALARIRWDPSVNRKFIKLGFALLSLEEAATCRSMYRTAHTCKYGDGCKYQHRINPFVEPIDLPRHEAGTGHVDAVTIVREIDYHHFDRLCIAGFLSPTQLMYVTHGGVRIWNAYSKEHSLWHIVTGPVPDDTTLNDSGIGLECPIPSCGLDSLPEAAVLSVASYCDDRALANLSSVSTPLCISMNSASIWHDRLRHQAFYRAAQLSGRIIVGHNWLQDCHVAMDTSSSAVEANIAPSDAPSIPTIVRPARPVGSDTLRSRVFGKPRMSFASSTVLGLLGPGPFSLENARQARGLYMSLARTSDWAGALRNIGELNLLHALKVPESESDVSPPEDFALNAAAVRHPAPGTPDISAIPRSPVLRGLASSPSTDRRSVVHRFQHLDAAEMYMAKEIELDTRDDDARSDSDKDETHPKRRGAVARKRPSGAASPRASKPVSADTVKLWRVLQRLRPLPVMSGMTTCANTDSVEYRTAVLKHNDWLQCIDKLLQRVLAALHHAGQPSLDERAAAELLTDALESGEIPAEEDTLASTTPVLDNVSTASSPTDGSTPPPHIYQPKAASALHVCRAGLRVKDPNGVAESKEKTNMGPVGIHSSLGMVRGGINIGSLVGGLVTPVKAVSLGEGKIVAVDRAGLLRVQALDGSRLAAGRAAGLSSAAQSTLAGPAGGGAFETPENRCCFNVCSVHHADNMIATGHPDGSVAISVMGSGQAIRGGAGIRFDDSLLIEGKSLPTSPHPARARSGSSQPTMHTSVAFMDHGSQIFVGRKVIRSSGALRSGGALSLYSSETGDIIRTMACSQALDPRTAMPQLPNVVRAINPNTAVVGYSDGSMAIWDVRTNRQTCLIQLHEDPVRQVIPEAFITAMLNQVPSSAPPAFSEDGAFARPLDDVAAEEQADPELVHVPGMTRPSWLEAPIDAFCGIQHIFADEFCILESRASPIIPVIGDPASIFAPSSSPFVRSWDIRGSTRTPFHVTDLGPKCLRSVAGVYFDKERVVIAHQHIRRPLTRHREAAAANLAPPMFHWNHRDRAAPPRAHTLLSKREFEQSKLWYQLLQSDVHLPLVPAYAWPLHHAPPTAITVEQTASMLLGSALKYTGEGHGMYGQATLVSSAPDAVRCFNLASPAAVEDATTPSPTPIDAAPAPENRGQDAGPELAVMSAISVWNPHTMSTCGFLPVSSITCLAGNYGTLVAGTDAGLIHWNTMAAADGKSTRRNSANAAPVGIPAAAEPRRTPQKKGK
jgi:hypothetical protein